MHPFATAILPNRLAVSSSSGLSADVWMPSTNG